jgi:hypothetical protein
MTHPHVNQYSTAATEKKMIDKPPPDLPLYEIRLKGHLDAQWMTWFDGLTIKLEENGDALLSGPVADQSALHGILRRVRDLGMPLVSVVQIDHEKGERMNSSNTSAKKIDTKVLLSTLWIVVMLNMLKADILSLFIPGAAEEVARTSASAGASIPQLMLLGAIMGNLAIAMIFLSRVLKHGINRWLNIIVGIVTIAYIWGGAALYPHYIFIASVETSCLLLIIGFAWMWRNTEA